MTRAELSIASLACLLLAACAGSPYKTKTPAGLLFDCEPGGEAEVRFNDGGYLPDSNAVGRTREGAARQEPRSTASLSYDGRHALVAEWAELGLRYRSVEPGPDGRHLILSLRGEQAWIGRRAAIAAPDEAPGGEPIAECRRAGRDAFSARSEEAH